MLGQQRHSSQAARSFQDRRTEFFGEVPRGPLRQGAKQGARRARPSSEVYGNGLRPEGLEISWTSTTDTSGASHEESNPFYACSDNTDSDFDPVSSGHHRANVPWAGESYDPSQGDQDLRQLGQQLPGDSQEETLRRDGEQRSAGSLKHPHGCRPCAFYCFSLRGCNRGAPCQFCHMWHESKLRQRREEWKRQQREKHGRSQQQRDNQQAPVMPLMGPQGLPQDCDQQDDFNVESQREYFANFDPAAPPAQSAKPRGIRMARGRRAEAETDGQPGAQPQSYQLDLDLGGVLGFDYQLKQVVVAVGQQVEIVPRRRLPDHMHQHFSVRPALPAGLHLDPSAGTISGAALAPSNSSFDFDLYVVTCRLQQSDWSFSFVHAELGLKVVDFVSNDFVVSHLSEVADGRFMILFTSSSDQQSGFHSPSPQQAAASCGYGLQGLIAGSAPSQL